MNPAQSSVLAINGGSSSIRFATYEQGKPLRRRLEGKVDRVGLSGTNLTFTDATGEPADCHAIDSGDHRSGGAFLLDWLEAQPAFASVQAVGHRVVHGMTHTEPERVTPGLIDELRRITPYSPEHLPLEIELIEAFRECHPALPQVACFDTAFHRTLPRVASMLPIPRRYEAAGLRRYGFHGLHSGQGPASHALHAPLSCQQCNHDRSRSRCTLIWILKSRPFRRAPVTSQAPAPRIEGHMRKRPSALTRSGKAKIARTTASLPTGFKQRPKSWPGRNPNIPPSAA